MLHALALGADWVWLADDDGRPADADGARHAVGLRGKAFPGRGVADGVRPRRSDPAGVPAAPRPGVAAAGSPNCASTAPVTCCPASRRCSTARCSARRRWKPLACRTFGCSSAATRWRCTAGWCGPGCRSAPASTRCTCTRRAPTSSSRSSAAGCTPSTPDDATKRYFTYRNRGYLQSQRGLRKLIPQEWVRFGWFFLVTRRDPAGLREWIRLRRLGRRERFERASGAREAR